MKQLILAILIMSQWVISFSQESKNKYDTTFYGIVNKECNLYDPSTHLAIGFGFPRRKIAVVGYVEQQTGINKTGYWAVLIDEEFRLIENRNFDLKPDILLLLKNKDTSETIKAVHSIILTIQ